MSFHTLNMDKDTVYDLFADATPSIPAGSSVYMQNVSASNIKVADDQNMTHYFVIGGLGVNENTSVMSLSAGATPFVSTSNYSARLTIEVL